MHLPVLLQYLFVDLLVLAIWFFNRSIPDRSYMGSLALGVLVIFVGLTILNAIGPLIHITYHMVDVFGHLVH